MLIRNRLTLIFTLLATSIQLVLSVLAWYFYSLYREQEFYARLEDTALVAGRLLISRRHLHDDFFKSMVKSDLLTLVDEQISIWDSREEPVFSNKSLTHNQFFKDQIHRLNSHKPVRFKSGRLEGIGVLYQDQGQNFYIFCAGYDSLGAAQLDNLEHILPLVNLIGFTLIVLAGWYFSNRALAPITTIVAEVESITHQHLNKRVNEGNRKDEIAQLAMTFNQMLQRLEDAFTAQTSFISHASHELRTPITNAMGTLETSMTYDHDPDTLKESMGVAIQELKRLISLTNGLLLLAKVQKGGMPLEVVQLEDCLLTAVSQIKSKYQGRSIQVQLPPEYAGYELLGNAPLLTTAFTNVLDNACKYSTEAVLVSLSFIMEGGAELRVQDSGIGIDRADMGHVLEPLYRGGNTSGVSGFGIGLSITQLVLQLHNAALSIDSKAGVGTTVTMRFLPKAEPEA